VSEAHSLTERERHLKEDQPPGITQVRWQHITTQSPSLASLRVRYEARGDKNYLPYHLSLLADQSNATGKERRTAM